MKKIDVIIIGAGPGGISAAIYLKRAGIDYLIFEKEMIGGKVSLTAEIDNYPPFTSISGFDLASHYIKDLKHNQIDVQFEDVLKVEKREEVFFVRSSQNEYEAKCVLIASGTTDKKLGIKGEKEFLNKGISHCAVCDGNLYKNQPMAVVGGGNSALEETLYLASITNKVYLIHRRDEFRGNKQYVDLIKENTNIEILTPYRIIECLGDKKLKKLIIENVNDLSKKELEVEALFEYVGLIPNTSFIQNKEVLNENGFIIVDNYQRTSIKGLFACGDVTNKPLRQIVIASGDGALSTHSIIEYLRETK